MRSAPTLKIWMTPFASVAMLEKLALLKLALCSAPAVSTASDPRRSRLGSTVAAVRFEAVAILSSVHRSGALRLRRRPSEDQRLGTSGSQAEPRPITQPGQEKPSLLSICKISAVRQ